MRDAAWLFQYHIFLETEVVSDSIHHDFRQGNCQENFEFNLDRHRLGKPIDFFCGSSTAQSSRQTAVVEVPAKTIERTAIRRAFSALHDEPAFGKSVKLEPIHEQVTGAILIACHQPRVDGRLFF